MSQSLPERAGDVQGFPSGAFLAGQISFPVYGNAVSDMEMVDVSNP